MVIKDEERSSRDRHHGRTSISAASERKENRSASGLAWIFLGRTRYGEDEVSREIGAVRGCLSGEGVPCPRDRGEIKVSGLRRRGCAQETKLLIRPAFILDNHAAHPLPERILEEDVGA